MSNLGFNIEIDQICQLLLQADPEIKEILMFGSGVYAPHSAKDIDLIVTTTKKKKESFYYEALGDHSLWVDLIVREPGQTISENIALSISTSGIVLFGDGETLKEAMKFMPVPTYEDGRDFLAMAEEDAKRALGDPRDRLKEKRLRAAFDELFDAARHAVICFLHTENSRWGQLRHQLPEPFSDRFRQIINALHIQYSYEGKYPKGREEEEFQQWKEKVSQFIADLEEASK